MRLRRWALLAPYAALLAACSTAQPSPSAAAPGPIEIEADGEGAHRVTMVSHGNFLFGQGWSQQTQEGVTLELSFRGTELVQARMHPYIMLEQAQTNLTNPETDGLDVLNRIYVSSGLTPADRPR